MVDSEIARLQYTRTEEDRAIPGVRYDRIGPLEFDEGMFMRSKREAIAGRCRR
jgi:hypothetical protein